MNLLQLGALPFQFEIVANKDTDSSHLAELVLQGGCRWIQLRMENLSEPEMKATAEKIKALCQSNNAVLMLVNQVDLRKDVNADGVVFDDLNLLEVNAALKEECLLGVICHTEEEVAKAKSNASYICYGPFQSAKGAKKSSIGIDGYQNMIWNFRSKEINIPVIAYGGISSSDVLPILKSGPNGVLLSDELSGIDTLQSEIEKIQRVFEKIF